MAKHHSLIFKMELQLNLNRGVEKPDNKMLKKLNIPQWNELLTKLYSLPDNHRYFQKLLKNADVTASHIRSIILLLEKDNLIYRISQRKIKYIVLTEKGRRTAQIILELKRSLMVK